MREGSDHSDARLESKTYCKQLLSSTPADPDMLVGGIPISHHFCPWDQLWCSAPFPAEHISEGQEKEVWDCHSIMDKN